MNTKLIFEEFSLPNKLHCVLHKNTSNPLVNVTLGYKVGAKDEKPGQYGAAHLFEHLMFEGSKNISKAEHHKIIMNCGGRTNAFTMQDATVYYEDIPANFLETALWLESDRMNEINLSEENLDNQKKVVLEEKLQRYDNAPYGTFLSLTMKNIFPGSLYEHTTIGEAEHIKNFSREDAIDFHHKYYSPANAELLISGDIDIEKTKKLIEKYFGDINKANGIIRKKNSFTDLKEDVTMTIEDNVMLEKFYISYKIPGAGSREEFALEYFTKLVFNNKSSRLYKQLVYDKMLLKNISSFKFSIQDAGVYIIIGTVNPGKSGAEAQKIIADEIKNFAERNIADYDMEKIRNEIEFSQVNKLISLNRINVAGVFNRMYFNNINKINEELSAYNSVSKDDVQNTIKDYFIRGKKVTLNYVPKKINAK
ncbi:MAG: insulinase family protein [Ignavibacteria bacterium]|nr:insulinase family protein [Ignavibacteria bacterium]